MCETRRDNTATRVSGIAGVLGGLACSTPMTAAALGIAGAGVTTGADMAGMDRHALRSAPNPVLSWAAARGPALPVVSAILVVVPLGLRQPWTVLPAVAAATLMYWGMYMQAGPAVMYATSILGLLLWIILFVTARGKRSRGQARPSSAAPAATG